MKKEIFTGIVILLSLQGFSQTASETVGIMAPITQLFKGMHLGDSTKVHSAFASEVTFVTVAKNNSGKSMIIPEPLDKFLTRIRRISKIDRIQLEFGLIGLIGLIGFNWNLD